MAMNQNYGETDELLWRRASAGEANSEEKLIEKYSVLVKIYARQFFLAGGDSEDLIQEGMMGLLSAVRHYDPARDASFRTFAELCIRNRLYTAVKAASRNKHSPLNDSLSLESPQFDECQGHISYGFRDPEELLISKERFEAVLTEMNSVLSPFESQVLKLYLEGLSYNEIAERVKKPVKSVDNAVQRIRKKLAQRNNFGDFS